MRGKIFFLIGGISLIFPTLLFAQVRLEKMLVKLQGIPGETVTNSISVENTSAVTLNMKTYAQDFTFLSPFDGGKKPLPVNTLSRSCAAWIKTTPEVFTLPPNSKQQVTYTLTVPLEAEGGYWAVLLFETIPGALSVNKKGGYGAAANVAIAVGCSMIIEMPKKTKTVKIENTVGSKNQIQASFLNTGNVILIFKDNYYVMDNKSLVVDKGKLRKGDYYFPPEEKIPFVVNLSEKIPAGNYTLVINFDLDGGGILLKEIDFSKDASGAIKIVKVRD